MVNFGIGDFIDEINIHSNDILYCEFDVPMIYKISRKSLIIHNYISNYHLINYMLPWLYDNSDYCKMIIKKNELRTANK